MRRLLSTSLGAVGEYYRIEDEDGRVRFRVDSKVVTLWLAVSLRDAEGHTLLSIQWRGFTPQAAYGIARDGQEVATVRQQWTSGHQRFVAECVGVGAIEMIGDWHEQAFVVWREGQQIARMEGAWFSMNARCEITMEPQQDDALILACAVMIHWTNEPAR